MDAMSQNLRRHTHLPFVLGAFVGKDWTIGDHVWAMKITVEFLDTLWN
jgi:hypothetical protein